jgi:hypothetical protein
MDIQNIIGCSMSLMSGLSATTPDGRALSPQSEEDMLWVAEQIQKYIASSEIKSEAELQRLEHYKHTLNAIAPFGSRYISNQYDNYFIIQCEFNYNILDDALEHESLDDMYDSMSIAHDIEREKFESSAIIVRQIEGVVQACDLRGCWSPLADTFAWRVEDWVNSYTL